MIVMQEAFNPLGARLGLIADIAVTATSAVIDLSTWPAFYAQLQAGRLMLADADGADVYYAFNSENSGTIAIAGATAAGPGLATQCARVPAGALVPMRPPYHDQKDVNSSAGAITSAGICRYLLVIASVPCTLRLDIVSETTSKRS